MSFSEKMVIDKAGYRLNVGIVLTSPENYLFWGRRIGQDTWQFPQGGVDVNESATAAMFRELYEEVGIDKADVELIGSTKKWLRYQLPEQYQRRHIKPVVIGQKQKWFLLRLKCSEQKIRLDLTHSPEFDSWRWVDYWHPIEEVIYFKQAVYQQALKEFEPVLFGTQTGTKR
jgi:putative (di)nucleoside polyphosphate hydrolase